ncbi:inositol-1-monophosphatase [Prevotella dentalis DSM 3688]|uniref:Inositol-1-monophosphatase n=1 Tax=Prevotella dentalis (strain ATCC 49559 / DSM 3688 / JCM 13448 / NCTC 12043 / ES 2772) TaxID=908937 RepID=F9D5P4_PREDD|nr:inositol-1-monophosphatase [Prevotella dentalis DSM 3688]
MDSDSVPGPGRPGVATRAGQWRRGGLAMAAWGPCNGGVGALRWRRGGLAMAAWGPCDGAVTGLRLRRNGVAITPF